MRPALYFKPSSSSLFVHWFVYLACLLFIKIKHRHEFRYYVPLQIISGIAIQLQRCFGSFERTVMVIFHLYMKRCIILLSKMKHSFLVVSRRSLEKNSKTQTWLHQSFCFLLVGLYILDFQQETSQETNNYSALGFTPAKLVLCIFSPATDNKDSKYPVIK